MKKFTLFAILVLIVLFVDSIHPVAAKPKPPVDPYPAPVELQGDAYPAPQPGMSAPAEPDEWCDGIYDFFCAYFNGIYVAWVNHLGFNPDLQIILCSAQVDTWWSYCREMQFLRYDVYKDRNVYISGPGPHECFQFSFEYNNGQWFYIIYAYAPEIPFVSAQYATLYQPNLFPIFCNYLPLNRKA